jgi:hypothetical protein
MKFDFGDYQPSLRELVAITESGDQTDPEFAVNALRA